MKQVFIWNSLVVTVTVPYHKNEIECQFHGFYEG
jgi:hypothetical protein